MSILTLEQQLQTTANIDRIKEAYRIVKIRERRDRLLELADEAKELDFNEVH